MLGIESAGLLLDCTKRTAHCNGRKLAGSVLWHIHVCRQFNSVTVVESNLAVIHHFRFRESLVPLLSKIKSIHIVVFICFAGRENHRCNANCH